MEAKIGSEGRPATVVSVDLASKDYASNGVCVLTREESFVRVEPICLTELGLHGKPVAAELARALVKIAEPRGARFLLLDGPQGWKDPQNGLDHSRVCERELATQGKTGLPGTTKPGSFAGFAAFSVQVFDELAALGYCRLTGRLELVGPRCIALETFPTSTWRALGLRPLPGRAKAKSAVVRQWFHELCQHTRIQWEGRNDPTHDELQALVSGLVGVDLAVDPDSACRLAGVAPFQLEGTWREGYIINPPKASVQALVSISLERDAALVLSEFFSRFAETDLFRLRNNAEFVAFSRIAGQLESILPEILDPRFPELLEQARARLEDGFEGSAPGVEPDEE